MTDALIHLRVPAAIKARWVRESRAVGMTPAEFRAWQAHMGLTVRAAAELLDVSPSTVQAYRTGTSRATGRAVAVPHVVALACAALAARLGPWRSE